MILGYARVSKGEEQDTKTQMIALKEAGAKRFFEEKASGGRWDRPELHKMLDQLREDDVVTVWKLDRLTRSLKDLLQIMDTINKAGAGFKSITENIDTTTPAGLMMMQMLGCFAEFERAMIRQRTKAGLKTARDEGRIGGRPAKLTDAQIKESLSMIKSGKKTAADIARLFRVHRTTISRLILKHNLDEFETPTEEKIVDNKKQNKSKPIPKQAKKKTLVKKKSPIEDDDEDLFEDEFDLNDEDNIEEDEDLNSSLSAQDTATYHNEFYDEDTSDNKKKNKSHFDDYEDEEEKWRQFAKSEAGVYEEYGHEKNLKLHYNPDFSCEDDEEYNKVREYIFKKDELEKRGWTDGAIKKFLGSPNFVVRFKYYAPWHFWFKKDALPWEEKQEFKDFLEKQKISQEKKKITDAEKMNKSIAERNARDKIEQEKRKEYTQSKSKPGKKIAIVELHISVENNNKFIRMKGKVIKSIHRYILSGFDHEKEDDTNIILKIPYETNKELNDTMDEIMQEISSTADLDNCFSESSAVEFDGKRSW